MFSKMMKNLTTERFFAKTLLSELAQKAFMVMLLCSLTISAYAQLSISGKVTDSETKKGLAGATLTIDNTMRGTITDAQGNFVIKNLKKGTYTIKVSFVGFENKVILSSFSKILTFLFRFKKLFYGRRSSGKCYSC
jgi:iron complex outermembrane receptor protein